MKDKKKDEREDDTINHKRQEEDNQKTYFALKGMDFGYIPVLGINPQEMRITNDFCPSGQRNLPVRFAAKKGFYTSINI